MVLLRLQLLAFLCLSPTAHTEGCLDRREVLISPCTALPLFAVPAKAHSQTPATQLMQAPATAAMEDKYDTGYLDAASAAALDEELMSTPGFTLEQLMELAGLSVAETVVAVAPDAPNPAAKTVLLVCGPGNNGGDGLVAARHLKLFGFKPAVVYPKRSSRQPHYTNLVQQCQDLNIDILDTMPGSSSQDFSIVVDAIFGFSFQGKPREPFASILEQLCNRKAKP